MVDTVKKMNLHVHTKFSDGLFTPREIIEASVKYGLDIIGISDHFHTVKTKSVMRKHVNEYIKELTNLKDDFKKYIDVKIGMEIDTCPFRTNIETFPFDLCESMDYVLMEYVNEPLRGGIPLSTAVKLRSKFDCEVGLAHNDIAKNFGDYDLLKKKLEENNIFIELASGIRNTRDNKPYYHYAPDFFNSLNGSRIKISVGTDMHRYLRELAMINDAYRFIKNMGIEDHLIY